MPRSQLLERAPGRWDATEATQTGPGGSGAVGDRLSACFLAKASGGREWALVLRPAASPPPRGSGTATRKAPCSAWQSPSRVARPPRPLDAVLRAGTGVSSGSRRRRGRGRGSVCHSSRPPSLTPRPNAEPEAAPRGGAQEGRRGGGSEGVTAASRARVPGWAAAAGHSPRGRSCGLGSPTGTPS